MINSSLMLFASFLLILKSTKAQGLFHKLINLYQIIEYV